MFNRNHNDPSIDEVEARLRAASPEVSDLDLDRLKRRIQTQVNLRRSTRGASLRHRLIPVLVSLGLLGGTGIFAVEALAANASNKQYHGPGGTSGLTILTCTLGSAGKTLIVTGTTTDKINSITVSSASPSFSAQAVITTTGSSPYTFTATLGDNTPNTYTAGTTYNLTAVQTLGGTATATCTP